MLKRTVIFGGQLVQIGKMRELKYAISYLMILSFLTSCSPDPTPFKFEMCDIQEKHCSIKAEFNNFESCDKYRRFSNSLCDWVTTPGRVICETCSGASEGCSQSPGTSRCTQ